MVSNAALDESGEKQKKSLPVVACGSNLGVLTLLKITQFQFCFD